MQRERLLALGRVLQILDTGERDYHDVIEGWMLSPNPHLSDRSPLAAIREDDGRATVGAARQFAS